MPLILLLLLTLINQYNAFQNLIHNRNINNNKLYMGTGNVQGKIFRISTFGESHGTGVGVIIDGCPPRIPLSVIDIVNFEIKFSNNEV